MPALLGVSDQLLEAKAFGTCPLHHNAVFSTKLGYVYEACEGSRQDKRRGNHDSPYERPVQNHRR